MIEQAYGLVEYTTPKKDEEGHDIPINRDQLCNAVHATLLDDKFLCNGQLRVRTCFILTASSDLKHSQPVNNTDNRMVYFVSAAELKHPYFNAAIPEFIAKAAMTKPGGVNFKATAFPVAQYNGKNAGDDPREVPVVMIALAATMVSLAVRCSQLLTNAGR